MHSTPSFSSPASTRHTTWTIPDVRQRTAAGCRPLAERINGEYATRWVARGTTYADSIIEPRVLAGFQTLFDRIDTRIADIVEDGIDRCAFVERVTIPKLGGNPKRLVVPTKQKFVPVTRASDLDVVRTLRERLRPSMSGADSVSPGRSRAELHTAIVHRPPPRDIRSETHQL